MSEWSAYCEMCRDEHLNTDCSTCEARPPQLMPMNRRVYHLWLHCQTQWNWSGGMEPLLTGLDYPGIYRIAEMMDVEITPSDLYKLQALEWDTIQRTREKMKRK